MKIISLVLTLIIASSSIVLANEKDKCEALKIITGLAGANYQVSYSGKMYSLHDGDEIANVFSEFYPQKTLVNKNKLQEEFTSDINYCIKNKYIPIDNKAFKGLHDTIISIAGIVTDRTVRKQRENKAKSINLAELQFKLVDISTRLLDLSEEDVELLNELSSDDILYDTLSRDAQTIRKLISLVIKESAIIDHINEIGPKKNDDLDKVITELKENREKLERNASELKILVLNNRIYSTYNQNLDKYEKSMYSTIKEVGGIIANLEQEKKDKERAIAEAKLAEARKRNEERAAEAKRIAEQKHAERIEKCKGIVSEYGLSDEEFNYTLESKDGTKFGEFLCLAISARALKKYSGKGFFSKSYNLALVTPEFEVIELELIDSDNVISINRVTAKGETRGLSKLESAALLLSLDMLYSMQSNLP